MRTILLTILISLHLHISSSALPFNCTNTNELQHETALETRFTTTYSRDYYAPDGSINIDVIRDPTYEESNIIGVFFSVFGVASDGSATTTSYGSFPIIITANAVNPTIVSPCNFPVFESWPGDIDLYWKATDSSNYTDSVVLCVGIAVADAPLTGYLNCKNIRRAEPVGKPDITSGHGIWDSSIDLTCSVTVFPAPDFIWYYNNVKIEADAHYSLNPLNNVVDEYQSILSVIGARTYDTVFNYHCTVTNILQTIPVQSDNAFLTIADLPMSVLEKPNATVNGFLFESIVLSCVFQSYPRPMIVWEKQGERIYNSSEIVIIPGTDIEDENGIKVSSRLAFSSLSHSDSGNYACVGMRGGSVVVKMNETFALDIISASSITFLTPPTVAVVSSYVTLTCQANGVPPPTIRWLNSAGMEIGTTSSISVRVMNAGVNTWTCEASNPGGTIAQSTTVTGYVTEASITTQPGDNTVGYRDKASFVCMASGDPVPVVTWFFTPSGGVEVALSGGEDEYSITESLLVIETATLKEQGTYRCEATNIANTVSASATLTIQVIQPSVQIRPASQSYAYNTPLTISCTTAGMPPPDVTIRKPDGTKVTSPHQISSFTEDNVGVYSCVAVSPANGMVAVQSAEYELTPLSVSVIPAAYSVDITSTGTLTLTCVVVGTPTYTTITWYHKNLCSNEILPITEPGFSQSTDTLIINPTSVTSYLPGEYICSVERFSVEYTGTAVISVSPLTDSISFSSTFDISNCPDLSGSLARTFSCAAVSSDSNPITYSWFLNSNRLDPGSDTTTISLSADGYGHYRCVATAGQLCEYLASDVDGGLSVDIEYNPPIPLNVEDSITIKCTTTGFPSTDITYAWFKDGTTLTHTTSQLTIGAVTTADSGGYKCSVDLTACLGVMESPTVTVSVIQTSPSISSQQNDVDIELGYSQVLTCSGMGIPVPTYQWYKDSVPIQNAESNTYTITSASTADNGLYTCELFSYVDRVFQNIAAIYTYQIPTNITITGLPTNPIEKGTMIVLTCTSDGIPAPDYTWFDFNATVIATQSSVEVTAGVENEYTCRADNGRGTAERTVTIPVIPDPSNLLIILPAVLIVSACVILLVMLCAVASMWCYNYRKKDKDIKGEIAEDSNVLLEDHVVPVADNQAISEASSKASTPSITGLMGKEDVRKLGGLDRSNPLTPTQLQIVISTVAKNGGFDGDNDLNSDFESTPSNMAKWTELPKDSEMKNRYMNVLPNQDTMVLLSDTGDSGSTFINANYITNYRSKKTAYIAAQGPLPSTIVDFWRMIWENDVSAVVMTCLLFERKRIRCARYWPDTKQRPTEIYGHFKLSVDSFARTDDYEVSLLYLVNLKAGPNEVQKKQIYHYWYKSWPTYGVPNETNRIWKFLEELHTTIQDSNKPILFHCSAGIGRTAVFIGTDMGIREYKTTGKVDPLKYLCLLRKGRGGSVQTAEQYLYLHAVLDDHIKDKQTAI